MNYRNAIKYDLSYQGGAELVHYRMVQGIVQHNGSGSSSSVSSLATPSLGWGGTAPGGWAPGGTAPGGTAPGGTPPGGTAPGGTPPGGTAPGRSGYKIKQGVRQAIALFTREF